MSVPVVTGPEAAAGTAPDPAPDPAQAAAGVLAALRIERGNPEPEELAALTVVLTHLAAGAPSVPPPPEPASSWADHRHALGLPPVPGPHGWRASALPR